METRKQKYLVASLFYGLSKHFANYFMISVSVHAESCRLTFKMQEGEVK